MSGEFGRYESGYFHTQMENAASDLATGSAEITRKWGEFFREFESVARAISWCEACDSGEDYPITESLEKMARLKAALVEIETYLDPFKRVAQEAVRKHLTAPAKREETGNGK